MENIHIPSPQMVCTVLQSKAAQTQTATSPVLCSSHSSQLHAFLHGEAFHSPH